MNTANTTQEAFVWIDPLTIKFGKNPRSRSNTGFTPEEMSKIKEDIRVNGHKLPLEIRYKDEVPFLIAGERRTRSILSLIEENANCFNRVTRQWGPAKEVYAKVCCFVTECDEANALMSAVLENMLHVPLDDYEIVLHCQLLEEAGMTRSEMAEKLKCSEAWISQTFSLLNPEKCPVHVLEAVAQGVLGRTQALQLLTYDKEKMDDVLNGAIEKWKKEEAAKEAAAFSERDELFRQWEKRDNEFQRAEEDGDEETMSRLRKELSENEKLMEDNNKKLQHLKKTKKKKPKPSMEHIQEAAMDEDADGSAKRHMPIKTLRTLTDKMIAEILMDKNAEVINPRTNEVVDVRLVRMLVYACNCILSRNKLRHPLEALFYMDQPLPEEIEEVVAEAAK